ncbi:hypothetical protein H2O64_07875 [Kordia sp. YSTF-M3]|uniref:Uncharacterized protein n=1 Tax=Kordia aestuariivivens TaxID=2759037 RepID=A0ABR7Q7X0_9FLAO|nr:hypothetical protein [Kordia aestuariivivens]MBC8754588.1 hypothetical protein [Kordia aestuariivivens]
MSEHIQLDFSVLKKTIVWWEKKRIWFNIIIGINGVLALLSIGPPYFSITEIVGIVIFGFFMNIFYSTGIILAVLDSYYFRNKFNLFRFRHLFIIIGTMLSIIFTWVTAFAYYFPPC